MQHRGRLSFLNLPPAGTIARNIVICLCLGVVIWKGDDSWVWKNWTLYILAAGVAIAAFVVGFTFSDARVLHRYSREMKGKPINETSLGQYITTSPDSVYMVFTFSYTCPHCLASVGNVEEALHTGVVDKVIGLSVGDSISEEYFKHFFKPTFDIQKLTMKEITTFTHSIPAIFLIRNDSVLITYEGETPAPYYFRNFRKRAEATKATKE